jgi:regulator of protease activity HflC (stomatin/prohibitin superfamily)
LSYNRLMLNVPLRAPGDESAGGPQSGLQSGPLGATVPPRRAGSVNLRGMGTGPGDDESSPLDPANQSLADALKIMLGLLQIGMAILAGLYFLSGVKPVPEGTQAIRLLFGAKQGEPLDPGLRFSAPFPLGELVVVKRGYEEIAIDRDFWLYVPDGQADNVSIEKLVPTASLKPDQGGSGSVLTADGNIAHTKWAVGFRREDAAKYAQNVLPQDEEKLIRAAVKRGVVHACSTVTIDELLKQSSSGASSVAARAKAVAQRTLDSFNSGLVIDQLTLTQTIAPLAVRSDFAKVQAAVSNAAKAVNEAETQARNIRGDAAGEAVDDLIRGIDAYEAALASGDKAAAGPALAAVDNLLQGTVASVDGAAVSPRVGGKVTAIISSAQRDRAAAVTRARATLESFNAKHDQFKQNPSVMIQTEWTRAVAAFMKRDSLQILSVPGDVAMLRLQMNPDPDLIKEIDRAQKERESIITEQKRLAEMERNRFKTNTVNNLGQ